MKKIIIIAQALIFAGCAAVSTGGRQTALISHIETGSHSSNKRLVIHAENHSGHLSSDGDRLIITFDNDIQLAGTVEEELKKFTNPCRYTGANARQISFICRPGVKVYPEVKENFIDLIFTIN